MIKKCNFLKPTAGEVVFENIIETICTEKHTFGPKLIYLFLEEMSDYNKDNVSWIIKIISQERKKE